MMTLLPQSSPYTLDEYMPPKGDVPVLYADAHLLIVDKPAGLLAVPGRQPSMQDCLISRVQQQYGDARIVHRLDMATSGLMVLARGEAMQRLLSLAFAQRQVDKQYQAVLGGLLAQDEGEVALPLGRDWLQRPRQCVDHQQGKPALTTFLVRSRDPDTGQTRVLLSPLTGRTHQLRVHMLALSHPIVGDALYGGMPAERLMLHACMLSLRHPQGGEIMQWQLDAPF